MEEDDNMSKSIDDWAELAAKELRGKPLGALNWNTLEGITVKPLYTADDVADLPHMDGLPGFGPNRTNVSIRISIKWMPR